MECINPSLQTLLIFSLSNVCSKRDESRSPWLWQKKWSSSEQTSSKCIVIWQFGGEALDPVAMSVSAPFKNTIIVRCIIGPCVGTDHFLSPNEYSLFMYTSKLEIKGLKRIGGGILNFTSIMRTPESSQLQRNIILEEMHLILCVYLFN